MDEFSDTKSKKKNLRQRHQKQNPLVGLLIALAILIILSLAVGNGSIIPTVIVVVVFAAALGSERYLISPKRVVSTALVDQELEWLFGKDKVRSITPLEFMFAQDRIRQRRAARWRFVLVSIPFWAIIGLLLFVFGTFQHYGEAQLAIVPLCIATLLLVLLVGLFVGAFPTKGMLARREPGGLANLALEVHARYGSLMRPNTWYRLSYDGELIEVTEEEALNSKAPSFNTGKSESSVGMDDLTSG